MKKETRAEGLVRDVEGFIVPTPEGVRNGI
jgi:hypothetical protein